MLQRKSTRLREYDYNEAGAYFVTVCTKDRKPVLCEIVGDGVLDVPPQSHLLPAGIIADKYIREMSVFYENISVAKYVIMPDHIHILLVVQNGASRTPSPTKQHATVSRFVSTFKRFCNKQYGENIWQASFNDHIVRNQEDFDKHWQYIENNPVAFVLES